MKKIVLLYNFSEERLQGVKRSLIPIRAMAKTVEKADYNKKLGRLVGLEGYEGGEGGDVQDFDEELLVMYGFDSGDIDLLIRSLRKYGVGRVALKAIVTGTNIDWNSYELYCAVRADHEEMQKNRSM